MSYIPQTTADWLRRLGTFSSDWYYGTEELIAMQRALHDQYGASPVKEILPIEQEIALGMQSRGCPHRYTDELSVQAATVVDNPSPVTVDEVLLYLSTITLDSSAVELVQDSDGGPIYLNVTSPLMKTQATQLLKLINKAMPPGAKVKALGRSASGTFAVAKTAFALQLSKREYSEPRVTTWDVVTAHLRAAAAAASSVFKEDKGPAVSFTVMKSENVGTEEEPERMVTGAVLVPDVVDLTTKNADGTATGAEGDIYDAEEIRKAMFWWAENAGRTFSYYHMGKSGQLLNEDDVKLLEIWQAREDYTEGEQEITKGTWMMTTRVMHEGLWDQIQKGEINSWSIGAHAMGAIEEVDASKLPTRP